MSGSTTAVLAVNLAKDAMGFTSNFTSGAKKVLALQENEMTTEIYEASSFTSPTKNSLAPLLVQDGLLFSQTAEQWRI
ncbi:MAG: hypothetical protein ACJZ87_10180 [Paracoccaceae bacterium]